MAAEDVPLSWSHGWRRRTAAAALLGALLFGTGFFAAREFGRAHTQASTAPASARPMAAAASAPPLGPVARADFGAEKASADAHQLANWVLQSADAQHRPFAILDKRQARLFVFRAGGRLQASAPVLLGSAHGDDSVPGIGTRKIADIRPEERTTPSGRFVVEPGRNAQGEDILWVDYEAAVSMHRVRSLVKAERRLQRLASATPADNRISYGCINVPVDFYDTVLSPAFRGSHGVVYVLPETRSLHAVFGPIERQSTLLAS